MFPSREELSKIVYVSSPEPFTGVWDGKEYKITEEPIQLPYGVAYHWKPTHEFNINDVPPGEISKRNIVNPLVTENQGEAFAAVKRRGRPREG